MKAKNKWNGKEYEVVEMNGNVITLKRADGSLLKISRQEFLFSYRTDKE